MLSAIKSEPESKSSLFGGFKKKTANLKGLATHAANLLVSPGNLYGILVSKRLDPVFREEIMVAISTLNACKYCNYAHHDFALQAGVPEEALAQLEGIAPENFDADKFLAITYARELANNNFSRIDPNLLEKLKQVYTKSERGDIHTTARIIMLFSMICNTSDAFVERVKGNPVEGSKLVDELVVATTFFAGILPVVGLYIALLRGENPMNTLGDFLNFSDQYGQ